MLDPTDNQHYKNRLEDLIRMVTSTTNPLLRKTITRSTRLIWILAITVLINSLLLGFLVFVLLNDKLMP